MPPSHASVSAHFKAYAPHQANPTDCWVWTGRRHTAGYGCSPHRSTHYFAHRASYELVNGQIPHGLVLDHLCRNRLCVNPGHLRTCTIAQNVTAPGSLAAEHWRRKTHCPQGHPYSPENTYINASTGGRHCRICLKAHDRKRQHKRRK